MLRQFLKSFWRWYEEHYALNIGLTTSLFLLQFVHLIWLTSEVVLFRLTGQSFFSSTGLFERFLIMVDYTEIPALLGASLVYLNELRKGWSWRAAGLLTLLNSQWLHLFWITDEFILGAWRTGAFATAPVWLVWLAIAIDYLELPVMADTLMRFSRAVHHRRLIPFLRQLRSS